MTVKRLLKSRSMLTAHTAYAQALKLQDNTVNAAGSARTLLKLPREAFDWQKYEGELARLVQAHAEAAPTEPSLLLADACVLRRRALMAPQRGEKLKLVEQAIDRFARLDAANRRNPAAAKRTGINPETASLSTRDRQLVRTPALERLITAAALNG